MVRQNMIHISKWMLAFLLSALFVSCKDEIDEAGLSKNSHATGEIIGFSALNDGFQKPITRAGAIDGTSDEGVTGNVSSIYVLSMKTTDNSSWSRVFKKADGTGIDVLTLTNSGGLIWEYSPEESWEDNANYKFRAYYPNGFNTKQGETCDGFKYTKPLNGSTNLTLNNYKSALNPKMNNDLLVSDVVTRNYSVDRNSDAVSLEMKHLMACVDFRFIAKEGLKVNVTKFTVNGYIGEGSCVCDEGSDPVWNINSGDVNSEETAIIWTIQNNGNPTGEIQYEEQSQFKFIDTNSGNELLPSEMKARLDSWYDPVQNPYDFYVVFTGMRSASSSLGTFSHTFKGLDDICVIRDFQGLLFLPQKLGTGDRTFDLTVQSKYNNYWAEWNNETHTSEWKGHPGDLKTRKFENVPFKNATTADIEFYFGSDKTKILHATVDLTAGGKVLNWEAGKKYIYNIAMYEYQVIANIYVEDWADNKYEEELK